MIEGLRKRDKLLVFGAGLGTYAGVSLPFALLSSFVLHSPAWGVFITIPASVGGMFLAAVAMKKTARRRAEGLGMMTGPEPPENFHLHLRDQEEPVNLDLMYLGTRDGQATWGAKVSSHLMELIESGQARPCINKPPRNANIILMSGEGRLEMP